MKTFFFITYLIFLFVALRAFNVTNDIPLGIGSLILSLICIVSYFYAAELKRVQNK